MIAALNKKKNENFKCVVGFIFPGMCKIRLQTAMPMFASRSLDYKTFRTIKGRPFNGLNVITEAIVVYLLQ